MNIPDRTTILGAAKVTGKTSDGWSLAGLAALTDREYGEVDSADVRQAIANLRRHNKKIWDLREKILSRIEKHSAR